MGGAISAALYRNTFHKESESLFTGTRYEAPILISRSVFKLSYNWWQATLSGREFNYLETSYTFNLDFKDQRGDNNDTGIFHEQFKVGLGIKLDLQPVAFAELPANN